MRDKKKIGLSLSGGGYRATAYHLGTLKKLKEMGILDDVDVISSVSGGSITSAYYGLMKKDFELFEKGLKKGLRTSIIKRILLSGRFILAGAVVLVMLSLITFFLFTNHAWISLLTFIVVLYLLIRFQFKIFPFSKIIEVIYDKVFFSNRVLDDLTYNPIVVINSTNLETGRLFTFSKLKMNDSYYEFSQKPITFEQADFPIARAVSASTCVPFAFTPVSIDKAFFKYESDYEKVHPKLVDGGVYDNQGIHKITHKGSSYECDIIITSDAGNLMPFAHRSDNTIQLLIRTSSLFMNRIKNFQMMKNIYETSSANRKEVAYLSLGWDISECIQNFIKNLKQGNVPESVVNAHGITCDDITEDNWNAVEQKLINNTGYSSLLSQIPTDEELEIARSVRTNLTSLNNNQINALVKHASSITELQVKLYCPSLITNK